MKRTLLCSVLSGLLAGPVAAEATAARVYIEEVTQALPQDIPARRNVHGMSEQAMPADIAGYARFVWMVDRVEGNCRLLGKRSNIEVINPSLGVTGWVFAASFEGHPNHGDLIAVEQRIDGFFRELGEDAFCALAYELLGPNGSAVGPTLRLNALMTSADLRTYEIRREDGVIWSARDYCERRYFLVTPPANQGFHDLACQQAQEQNF